MHRGHKARELLDLCEAQISPANPFQSKAAKPGRRWIRRQVRQGLQTIQEPRQQDQERPCSTNVLLGRVEIRMMRLSLICINNLKVEL